MGHAASLWSKGPYEDYRKKGLISHALREISKKIMADGDLPEFKFAANSTLLKRDGFLDMYETMCVTGKNDRTVI